MNDKLGNRRLHHWNGTDRQADIAVLAVAIAATGELFNHNGTLVQLRDGKLIPISSNELHELITRHVAAVRVVKRDGVWQREFYSYEFAQKPNFELPTSTNPGPGADSEREPDVEVLNTLLQSELLTRVPRAEP
jgi:hypothetical protein